MYTKTDHSTWQVLTTKRRKSLSNEACDLYLKGLNDLHLPSDHIPDHLEMNKLIQRFTAWEMIPTNELITAVDYFKMLAQCQFPAITSIRPNQEINFFTSVKPDVIHEYFGHGPLLINTDFAHFMQRLAQIATTFKTHEQVLLGRLFWFTTEFGLIQTQNGLRVYGAGIIPSETETLHALYNPDVERRPFNLVDILRTPFTAIDKQKIYYVIPGFDVLYSILESDLRMAVEKALR